MKPNRLWLVAAVLLISMSAIIGCAHHAGGGGGCNCQAPGGYGGAYGAPAGGTYVPPGSGGGVAPYQAPRGSGLF